MTTISGTKQDDILTGTETGNIMDGGVGADVMTGLGGRDTYIVDNLGDRVVEGARGGWDTVRAYVSHALQAGQEIEILEAASRGSTHPLSLTGNEYIQTITGNAGNNVLDGGGGADRLTGLSGDDTYIVDNAGDYIVEAGNRGYDTVLSHISYKLYSGLSIEAFAAADPSATTALSLTGNAYAQTITGNAGNNTLNGGGGADTLVGLGGNDTYVVDNLGDRVVEAHNGGYDTVLTRVSYALQEGLEIEALSAADLASQVALRLTGNAFGQSLTGNAASNVLKGLGGSDTFVFAAALGERNVDRIADFAVSTTPEHDTIQLAGSVFTALAPGGLAASAFKNLNADGTAIDADDRILYKQATGELFYDADGSGNGAAVKFAVLDNKAALTHTDVLVV